MSASLQLSALVSVTRGAEGRGLLCDPQPVGGVFQVSAASPWVWTDGERDEWCLLQSGRLCCGSGTCRCLPGRAWRVPSNLGFFWVACWPAGVELPCSRLNRFHSERLRITGVMGLPEKAMSSPGPRYQRGAVYCPAGVLIGWCGSPVFQTWTPPFLGQSQIFQ